MPTIGACVVNLGCKVNRVESDWFETALRDAGCVLVGEEEADLVVVNTCAVTGEAQAKARKAVRKAANAPGRPLVAVTGCVANLFPDELEGLDRNVRVFASKESLVADALALCAERSSAHALEAAASPSGHATFRARRGVKVQDGCDNQCTYCIVWKARGPVRSTPLPDIERQVAQILSDGAGEVVLSGINLGKFRAAGADGTEAFGLAGLIERVCSWGAPLVRVSSIEPPDLSPDVVQTMARHEKRVAPHLHLPLQAGCDATLARMGRRYSCVEFEGVVAQARSVLPALSLTTDVIVGFPGETDEDFEETLRFCERVGFSKIHVFRFSARPDTPAASMGGQVPPEAMRERSERLRALGERLRREDARRRVGDVETALVEFSDATGVARGTTASYHDFYVSSDKPVASGVVRVRLDAFDATAGRFEAHVVGSGA